MDTRWEDLLEEDKPKVEGLVAETLNRRYSVDDETWVRVKLRFVEMHGTKYELGELSECLRAGEEFRLYAVPALAGAFARRLVRSLKDPSTGRTLGSQVRKKLPPKATESEGGASAPTPRQQDEGLALLGFVAERIVEFGGLVGGAVEDFRLSGVAGPSVVQALCEEWNRIYPYWRKESKDPENPKKLVPATATFARAYSRALAPERGLLRELVAQVRSEVEAAVDKSRLRLEQNIKRARGGANPALLSVEEAEPVVPDGLFDRQRGTAAARAAYREPTRQELIERRVGQMFDSLIWREPTDSLLAAPLREEWRFIATVARMSTR